MISFSNTSRNLTNYELVTGNQRLSTTTPIQSGGLNFEKLKKIWARRVKPIIAPGSSSTFSKVHRRRTVATDMIGFPQGFTHSNHMSMHEVSQVEPHLRHSNDLPHFNLFNPAESFSLSRLPELEAEPALDIAHEDHTMSFGAKYNTRHYLCSSPTPDRPMPKKVKRKSVPIDFMQGTIDSSPLEVNPGSTHDPNRRRHSRVSIEEFVLEMINYEQPQNLRGDQVGDKGIAC